MGTTVKIDINGGVWVSGIDYGPNVMVHSRNNVCIVLRVPGHTRWSGVGSTKYESPKLLVYRILDEGLDGRTVWLKVEPMMEISQKRRNGKP